MTFGEVVASYLRELGISQSELARRMNTGRQTVNSIIIDDRRRSPRLDTAMQIADALGVPLQEMIDRMQSGEVFVVSTGSLPRNSCVARITGDTSIAYLGRARDANCSSIVVKRRSLVRFVLGMSVAVAVKKTPPPRLGKGPLSEDGS